MTPFLKTSNHRESKTFRGYVAETYPLRPRINSIIDDKTTHEIYLWSFAEAVRAGTSHVMYVVLGFLLRVL